MSKTPVISDDSFFYKIEDHKYIIADLEMCEYSDRCFDMSLFSLANNLSLCMALKLSFIISENMSYKRHGESLCKELCGNLHNGADIKAMSNPKIRLLVMDKDLHSKIKKILDERQPKQRGIPGRRKISRI